MPIPPALFELIEIYLEDRRPAHLSTEEWQQSNEILLRRPPAGTFPLGRAAGRRRIEELFIRLQGHAPDLFARGDLSLHSYRHALGTFTDGRYGRAVTRAVLGHTSRRTPTDHYVHVPIDQVADVLADYEAHLLSWDRARVIPIESTGASSPGGVRMRSLCFLRVSDGAKKARDCRRRSRIPLLGAFGRELCREDTHLGHSALSTIPAPRGTGPTRPPSD